LTIVNRQHDDLIRLAERYGVERTYFTVSGEERTASPEALLAVLRALGAQLESVEDAGEALDRRRWYEWSRPVDPVVAVWGGGPVSVEVRLPPLQVSRTLDCTLYLEAGEQLRETFDLQSFKIAGASRFGRESFIARQVELPWEIPPGYHRLEFQNDEQGFDTLLISAPERAYAGPDEQLWGVFLPLYALHSETSWGAGNYSDLERLFTWVREQDGELVGTLPLLPTFLEEPFDPSPYSPISRRFWNEFFVDVSQVPELEASDAARQIIASDDFQRELRDLRSSDLVDYRNGMQLRRRVLEELSKTLLSSGSARRAEFEAWAEREPLAREYARFRAAVDAQRASFHQWPERMRAGELRDDDVDPAVEHFYLYAQWLAQTQIEALAERVRRGGSGLYLDLPLGTNGGGFDIWKEPGLFVSGMAIGAPPDPLHEGGQNWGFPPMHPDAMREQRYRHLIEVLRHHMRLAGTLRIDHVMGLHRQFWIPADMDGRDGVYVKYRAEELYAILALESHRNKTLIIGEDLGTVPGYVRPMMERHNIYRMVVLPFALSRERESLINVPPNSMASLNTHDIPPFATFWNNADDVLRDALRHRLRESGYLEGEGDLRSVTDAVTAYLAASSAKMLMINAEDLWQETESQNVPGTSDEHPNWRRKAQRSLEQITADDHIRAILQRVDSLRESASGATNANIDYEGGEIGD
jgi:4-alpha-glucanotransferase